MFGNFKPWALNKHYLSLIVLAAWFILRFLGNTICEHKKSIGSTFFIYK